MNRLGRKLSTWRYLAYAVSAGALLIAAAAFAPAAHADPHAVFYTAIGQQQLFFNVLAALDQADYVEPAKAAKDATNSREALVKKRGEAPGGMKAADDPVLTSTATELSSVLTRSVTLEGQDLWTAMLMNDFAKERRRRKDMYDILKVFCQRGLGIPACKSQTPEDMNNPDLVKKTQRLVDGAFIHNPSLYEWERPLLRGAVAAARSGISAEDGGVSDKEVREEIIQEQNSPTGSRKMYPYGYDYQIAALREEISKNPSEQRKNQELALDLNSLLAISSLKADSVDPYMFSDISEDGSLAYSLPKAGRGGVALAANELEGLDYIAANSRALSNIVEFPSRLLQSLQGAQHIYQEQAEALANDDGSIADFQLRATRDENTGSPGALVADIRQPVGVKTSQSKAVAEGLLEAAANPMYSNTKQENKEGTQDSFTNPGRTSGARIRNGVLGATTGQVAGTTSGDPDGILDTEPDPDLSDMAADDLLKPLYKDSALADVFNISTDWEAYGPEFGGPPSVAGISIQAPQAAPMISQDNFFTGLTATLKLINKR